MRFFLLFLLLFILQKTSTSFSGLVDDGNYSHLYPKVCLSIRINHHEHSLPYFLGLIENLRYPKNRMHVAFFAENTSDSETIGSAK